MRMSPPVWCYCVGDALQVKTVSNAPVPLQPADVLNALQEASGNDKNNVKLGLLRADPSSNCSTFLHLLTDLEQYVDDRARQFAQS